MKIEIPLDVKTATDYFVRHQTGHSKAGRRKLAKPIADFILTLKGKEVEYFLLSNPLPNNLLGILCENDKVFEHINREALHVK